MVEGRDRQHPLVEVLTAVVVVAAAEDDFQLAQRRRLLHCPWSDAPGLRRRDDPIVQQRGRDFVRRRPHRPGRRSLANKEAQIRREHRIPRDLPADATFADSNAYSDWRFVYAPLGAASAGQAALGADTQLSNAAAPNFNTGGTNVAPPGATSPMGPAPMGGMPQDSQVCNAARASDFRACASATMSQAKQECVQAATQRYNSCISAAGGTTK
jgi:hypothetical protein